MDAKTMTHLQQQMWDGAAPMYARFVSGRLNDANNAIIAAVEAHMIDKPAAKGAPALRSLTLDPNNFPIMPNLRLS